MALKADPLHVVQYNQTLIIEFRNVLPGTT